MTNRKVSLEFAETDLPLLADALRTAACIAMTTGNHAARKRLDSYQAAIKALIPEPAQVFTGASWSEICMVLAESKTYSVSFEEWGWDKDGKYGAIYVSIGNQRWRSDDYKHYPAKGTVDAVIAVLETIAPLDCVHVAVEDTLPFHRRPHPPAANAPAERSEATWVSDDPPDDDPFDMSP
jgi:hypothetical protein